MLQIDQAKGKQFIEGVSLDSLAERFGTPLYVYSATWLENRAREFVQAFSAYPTTICYAVKACSNKSILKSIFSQGIGADTVSLGEIKRAMAAGCNPDKIVFSGVGKTREELREAILLGIKSINIESLFELENVGLLGKEMNSPVSIAIRLNLDIEAPTHDKIATGSALTKFGVCLDDIGQVLGILKQHPLLQLKGLACHLGSQIKVFDPIRAAGEKLAEAIQRCHDAGCKPEFVDLGGGLGIAYQENEKAPAVSEWAEALIQVANTLKLKLVIEPGRSLVAESGILLAKVLGIKNTKAKNFLVIDAAMNDLMRPTLYDAYHHISCCLKNSDTTREALYDVVGPVCETGDYIAIDRILPGGICADDLIIIHSAGAYGASMASNYNSRPLLPEVLVRGEQASLIRSRQSYEQMWSSEIEL